MPRKKYPHAKVHTSMRTHRKGAKVWCSNDLLAAWVRLLAHGVETYATKTDCIVRFGERDAIVIAGTKRIDSAVKVLNNLCTSLELVLDFRDGIYSIQIPKFAIKQGFEVHDGNATGTSRSELRTPNASSSSSRKKTRARARRRTWDQLSLDDQAAVHERVRAWNARQTKPLSKGSLDRCFEVMIDKALARGYAHVNWARAFMGYIRDGWPLKQQGERPEVQQPDLALEQSPAEKRYRAAQAARRAARTPTRSTRET